MAITRGHGGRGQGVSALGSGPRSCCRRSGQRRRHDLVVSNNNGPLRVILNKAASQKSWLGLRLVSGKRDAYGARVEIKRGGAPPLWRRVRADGSYLSANDPRILVGLGDATQIESMTVYWPNGKVERFAVPVLRQYTTLVQGGGSEVPGK
jgi:hypothetical protein